MDGVGRGVGSSHGFFISYCSWALGAARDAVCSPYDGRAQRNPSGEYPSRRLVGFASLALRYRGKVIRQSDDYYHSPRRLGRSLTRVAALGVVRKACRIDDIAEMLDSITGRPSVSHRSTMRMPSFGYSKSALIAFARIQHQQASEVTRSDWYRDRSPYCFVLSAGRRPDDPQRTRLRRSGRRAALQRPSPMHRTRGCSVRGVRVVA